MHFWQRNSRETLAKTMSKRLDRLDMEWHGRTRAIDNAIVETNLVLVWAVYVDRAVVLDAVLLHVVCLSLRADVVVR